MMAGECRGSRAYIEVLDEDQQVELGVEARHARHD
jgi:hypothetical protein